VLAVRETLGDALKKARSDRTQVDVADELEVSQATYARWERDDQEPDEPNLIKVMAFLGISVAELSELIAETRLQDLKEEMRRLERRLAGRSAE